MATTWLDLIRARGENRVESARTDRDQCQPDHSIPYVEMVPLKRCLERRYLLFKVSIFLDSLCFNVSITVQIKSVVDRVVRCTVSVTKGTLAEMNTAARIRTMAKKKRSLKNNMGQMHTLKHFHCSFLPKWNDSERFT